MSTDEPMPSLAENIRKEMEQEGFNPYSLAVRANLKADAIRDLLRGKKKGLGPKQLAAVAAALNRTPGQLMGTEPMPDPSQLVRPSGPGQHIQDPAELTLIAVWRTLTREQRHMILDRILRDFGS